MTEPVYVDLPTEFRVVLSLLTEPSTFALCSDLGLPDLTDYRLRAILTAIRSLPNHADAVSVDTVLDEIRLRDMANGTQVAELITLPWLAEMLLKFEPYRGECILLEHDLWWLRELSQRRERAVAA